MKKIIGLLLGLISVCALASCDISSIVGEKTGNSSQSESVTSEAVSSEEVSSTESNSESVETPATSEKDETSEGGNTHKHLLTRVAERKATCNSAGNITYWKCSCGAVFTDAMGTKESTIEEVTIAQLEHTLKYTAGAEATCISNGKLEYCG